MEFGLNRRQISVLFYKSTLNFARKNTNRGPICDFQSTRIGGKKSANEPRIGLPREARGIFKPPLKTTKAPAFRLGLLTYRATSYSPTHLRVQYNRG